MPEEYVALCERPDFEPVDFRSILVPSDDGREKLVCVSSTIENPNVGLKYTDFNVDVLQASGMADKLPTLGLLQRDPLTVADSIMHLPAGTFDLIDSGAVPGAVPSAPAAPAAGEEKITENNAV